MSIHGVHMLRATIAWCVLIAATCVISFGMTGSAQAQGVVKSIYGEWQLRCDTPPGAQGEQCALIQAVTAEDRPNVSLTAIMLKTADQKNLVMRILAPLGVLLPSGLGLRINQTDVGHAGFVRCLPNGCVAEVVMDDNLVKLFRIPLSLKGFGEGYDKLP